jgi:hypothetical protein
VEAKLGGWFEFTLIVKLYVLEAWLSATVTSITTEPTWPTRVGAIVNVLPASVTNAGSALVPVATAEMVTGRPEGAFVAGRV